MVCQRTSGAQLQREDLRQVLRSCDIDPMSLLVHVTCLLFHETFGTERLIFFFLALDLFLVLGQSQPVTESSLQWLTSRGIGEVCHFAILTLGKGKSNQLTNKL